MPLKVLGPFLSRALEREQRAAADCGGAVRCDLSRQDRADPLEMVRGGIGSLPFDVTVFCEIDRAARPGVRRDDAVRCTHVRRR